MENNNITKTIMESMESYEEKFNVFGECNPPHCHNIRFGGNFVDIGNHLLQSQIKVIEAVIEEMKSKLRRVEDGKDALEQFGIQWLNKPIEDQISSLNETLEFIKKSL